VGALLGRARSVCRSAPSGTKRTRRPLTAWFRLDRGRATVGQSDVIWRRRSRVVALEAFEKVGGRR
jgi:hypothetical protein